MSLATKDLKESLIAAKDLELIRPTRNDNSAVKKSVNTANQVLSVIRGHDEVGIRDLMYYLDLCEHTSRKYLNVLFELGYLKRSRRGKEFYYSYSDDSVQE